MSSKVTPIAIFQKNWAFTSSQSEKPQIKTGSFGPCIVVTFAGGGFAAMAHIDDTTSVESMNVIFERFKSNSVAVADIRVVVMGGWKEYPESNKWGKKIIRHIQDAGFTDCNTKHVFSKKSPNPELLMKGFSSDAEAFPYFYKGLLVDAKNGKTFTSNELDADLEEMQYQKAKEMAINSEFPITEITG